MKTKTFFKTILAAILVMAFISCTKSATQQPANLNGSWSNKIWYNVSGNICTFSVGSNATTGVITQLGSQPFNFSVGDALFSNITAAGTGAYNAMGKYTYGAGNTQVGSTVVTLTLQNNNKQLYVQYSPDASTGITPPNYIFKRQ